MTQPTAPTAYLAEWVPPHVRERVEEVALAVDSYVAALSDEEFAELIARTRPEGGR
jgi:hypothetical protein